MEISLELKTAIVAEAEIVKANAEPERLQRLDFDRMNWLGGCVYNQMFGSSHEGREWAFGLGVFPQGSGITPIEVYLIKEINEEYGFARPLIEYLKGERDTLTEADL